MEIQEIFEEFIKNALAKEMFYSQIGKAINVDADKRTCDFEPIEDIAKREGIRLQSIISQSKGFVVIPKENSDIIVTFLNRSTGFVSLTSEVEKILIDTDLTQFNGGDNGGLININDLITKLNIVENDLNTIKTAISAWVPTPNDGGAGLKVALTTWFGDQLTPTVALDMEDMKVTH